MSDLQDVIVTTTVRAFNSGVDHERKRIVRMLKTFIDENPISSQEEHTIRAIEYFLSFIEGEQK